MNQTICITGASSGFGEASARLFSSLGWHCILMGRRTKRLEKLASELGNALPVTLDVRNKQAVIENFAQLTQTFNIDVLLNNAGLALGTAGASDCALEDWDTMVDTNIKGLMYCTHAIIPHMKERQKGHIICLGSIAGTHPYPGSNVYGGTKAFVLQFAQGLRADLIGTPIRVSNIEPGLAESEFSLVRYKGDAEKAQTLYANTEALQPEDIAEIVRWMVYCPAHVNINRVEVMPVCQAPASLSVHRKA